MKRLVLAILASFLIPVPGFSADLLFREDWKELPPEFPISQSRVAHPDLLLSLYGPGEHGIKHSHHDWIENDPYYVWSGACPGNWAVGLRLRTGRLDLSGDSKIRWRSKQSGFRQLRIILRTAEGKWLVSDQSDGESKDWRVKEFDLSTIHWRELNISRVTEEKPVENPDLTQIEEVGFTDLMPGGISLACSRLDWIEVYGQKPQQN